jgi:hypothetical protein
MLPYNGIMHSAIGAELSDFMLGKETAKKTLSDIEDAYRASAKEKLLLWPLGQSHLLLECLLCERNVAPLVCAQYRKTLV